MEVCGGAVLVEPGVGGKVVGGTATVVEPGVGGKVAGGSVTVVEPGAVVIEVGTALSPQVEVTTAASASRRKRWARMPSPLHWD
jgi:hypothetical protein